MVSLFSPTSLGTLKLRNRIVMAPMTRSRSTENGAATDLMAWYYGQRASAGLIVTEGIAPSEDGKGYCRTPVLDSSERADGWRPVTSAVHQRGGLIVAQAMHCGRIAHKDNKAPDAETVAPSAVRATGEMYTDANGLQPFDQPRELTEYEVPGVVAEYRRFAALAVEAGFDGVELHGTSGYLPAQFLCTGTNRRTDAYGGPVQNRIRFVVEVLHAMADEVGANRIGLRICPGNPFNDLQDEGPSDVEDTFRALLEEIRPMGLAYLHVIRLAGAHLDNLALARDHHDGALIANDSFDAREAEDAITAERCDAVSFARYFLANPDLVERFADGLPLARFDSRTLYTPGPAGYIDYPTAGEA